MNREKLNEANKIARNIDSVKLLKDTLAHSTGIIIGIQNAFGNSGAVAFDCLDQITKSQLVASMQEIVERRYNELNSELNNL